VMEIDAEKSALGPEAEGVPISIAANGDVVRQPLINTTTAQTTISAMNGQTVVLGGLITKTRAKTQRRVPLLSSIPILGNLFRYDLEASERTELLIIMTPHVVRNDDDVNRLRQIETSRMSWVLGDVKKVHGTAGFGGYDVLADEETLVIYPDQTPGAEQIPAGKPVETPAREQQDALDLSIPSGAPPATTPGTAPPGTRPPNLAPPRGGEPGTLPMPDGSSANPLPGGAPIGVDVADDELMPTTVSYGAPPAPRGASIIPAVPPAYLANPPAADPSTPAIMPVSPMPPFPPPNDSGRTLPGYQPQPQTRQSFGAPNYAGRNYGDQNYAGQSNTVQNYAPPNDAGPAYGQPYASPAGGGQAYPAVGQIVPVGYAAPVSHVPVPNGGSYGNPYANSYGSAVGSASTGVGP
jgi:general secretion pathway protein D